VQVLHMIFSCDVIYNHFIVALAHNSYVENVITSYLSHFNGY